jgi:hypothetical protein
VEVAGPVTETILICLFIGNQGFVMTLEAELVDRKAELILEVGNMGGMATQAVVFLNRTMNTLLCGLVLMTLVTDLGTLVFDPVQAMVALMVTCSSTVAGSALFISQPAVDEGCSHLATVTLVAGLTACGINSTFGFSGRNN